MKKLIAIISAVLMAACCIGSACADVIFEPRDSFYESHRDQCEYHDRSYTANGPNGNVKVYENPESDAVRATVQNGEEIYVSHLYQDSAGIIWGYTEQWESEVSGWIPMDYLELIYDERSFEQDHGDAFQSEEGTLSEEFAGQTIYFWEYPGSVKAHQVSVGGSRMPQYQVVYVDANGNRWGRVGYFMSMCGWINLDNPAADYDTLYPNAAEATEAPAQPSDVLSTELVQEIVPQASEGTLSVVILTVAAVVAIVAVTVVLLVLLKRKK